MPELPEVETIRRQLAQRIEGGTIARARVDDPRLVDPWMPEDFAVRLAGRRVRQVGRHGKYLLLELDGDEALLLHLRMTGQLLWDDVPPPEPRPYTRAVIEMADGGAITFADARRFGTAAFLPRRGRTGFWRGRAGIDAMSPSFTARRLGDARVHAGHEQGLVGVDVSHAGDDALVEDERLHRRGPARQRIAQAACGERR